jgi:REP element-mobilizing transposase RayT
MKNAGQTGVSVPQKPGPKNEIQMGPKMHFYRRNLPHIEEFDATYFVTFRVWKYPYLPPAARSIALRHCLFENGRRIELHASVIMPTHVHLLFTALEDERGYPFSLAEIMKGIKGVSASNINKLLKRRGQLWQDESFDRIMRVGEFQDKLDYIIANPISAGLAKRPGQYKWVWLQKIAQAGVPVPQKSTANASKSS